MKQDRTPQKVKDIVQAPARIIVFIGNTKTYAFSTAVLKYIKRNK